MPDFGDDAAEKINNYMARSFIWANGRMSGSILKYLLEKFKEGYSQGRWEADKDAQRSMADQMNAAARASAGDGDLPSNATVTRTDGATTIDLDISDSGFLDAKEEAEKYCSMIDDKLGGPGKYSCEIGSGKSTETGSPETHLIFTWHDKDAPEIENAISDVARSVEAKKVCVFAMGTRDMSKRLYLQSSDSEKIGDIAEFMENEQIMFDSHGLHPEFKELSKGQFALTFKDETELEQAFDALGNDPIIKEAVNSISKTIDPVAQAKSAEYSHMAARMPFEQRLKMIDSATRRGVFEPSLESVSKARSIPSNPVSIRKEGQRAASVKKASPTSSSRAETAKPTSKANKPKVAVKAGGSR
jgi:hypothetical protein